MSDPDYRRGCAYVAGNYLPVDEAAIPITDTGFTRSDATYDVAAVWRGKFFRLDDHLDRFERNWQQLRMQPPIGRVAMREVLLECVIRAGLRDAYVEMIVTRGVPRDGDRDPRNFHNRFYAFAIPYVWIARPEQQLEGIAAVIAATTHRIPSAAVDPSVKNFHWGDLTKGLFEAYDRGALTAVLLDENGYVTEGPGFNVFGVSAGRLITAPDGVLQGITRATVMTLAGEAGYDTDVRRFDAATLRACDEVFLTSTAGGVMPVTELDGERLGAGTPGPVTMMLRERYWAAHDDARWTTVIEYRDNALRSAG